MKKQVEKFTDFITQIETWSKLITEHGLEAIEEISEACEGNEKILKAILVFIMGVNPDLMELVNSYYNRDVANPEAALDDDVFSEIFKRFSDIISNKFDEIYALLTSGKVRQGLNDLVATGIAIEKFSRCQLAIVDDRSINQYQYMFEAVANTKDSIDRLQEYIMTNDQDRLLEELIDFKKKTAILESYSQKALLNNS